jgi:hypothetical protein
MPPPHVINQVPHQNSIQLNAHSNPICRKCVEGIRDDFGKWFL